MTPEHQRLQEDLKRTQNWKRWGPYLSERQWGTVREDYSPDGESWHSFTHDQARKRAYRWGEDGILGITDRQCRLCFALSFWNGKDPILKERLYGLTGPEGNHGEDCKEIYYYLDSTPTHSYMKGAYYYPQNEYPYQDLLHTNQQRGYQDDEYELEDSSGWDASQFFAITAEYIKNGPDDILIQVTITNNSEQAAPLHFLPTLWYRNTWIWGCEHEGCTLKPTLAQSGNHHICGQHESLHHTHAYADSKNPGLQEILFTENLTNSQDLYGQAAYTPYTKDAFHRHLIQQEAGATNPQHTGTKAAWHYSLTLEAHASQTFRFRLDNQEKNLKQPFRSFDSIYQKRLSEADQFYQTITPQHLNAEDQNIFRQANAGLLWTKQFYHYSVKDWLAGDPEMPEPPGQRKQGRNAEWQHLFNRDIISMPDKWEYPWYAAWDSAFHMIPFAHLDPHFAKEQLLLFLREWYMHPNGQIPAYEFNFSDVNPPVHAWACWRVYKMTGQRGQRDIAFLEKAFHKLLINFTWWVNRKDPSGKNLFSGGFLGLDNIGVFDRSKPLPGGAQLEQADGTAWMAFYCSTMLSIALELAAHNQAYSDVASKFFEHYANIVQAINQFDGQGLWDEDDGFYYDRMLTTKQSLPIKLRSMVGLIPLFAVEILQEAKLAKLPFFTKRMNWFLEHRKEFCYESRNGRHLLSIVNKDKLQRIVRYLCDETEFLSPYGIRSLSQTYQEHPYSFTLGDTSYQVPYTPGESRTGLFGGNSNWRGPIWFPVNYLLIESLEKYHHFYEDTLKLDFPGYDEPQTLSVIAQNISQRLINLFRQEGQQRPCHGASPLHQKGGASSELIHFYEYFHADTGRGLGASHQTGWTALVAKLLEDSKKE